MGFFENIQHNYGRNKVTQMKEFMNNLRKIANLRNRRIFLLRCRQEGIQPKHIDSGMKRICQQLEYKDGKTAQQMNKFTIKLGHKVTNKEIELTHKNLKYLENRQQTLTQLISTDLPELLWEEFLRKNSTTYNRSFFRILTKNRNKLQRLIHDQVIQVTTQEKWLKNLSSTELPADVKTVLSLGPKFCLPPTKGDIQIPKLLAEMEKTTKIIQNKDKNITTAKIANIITNYVQKDIPNCNPLQRKLKATRQFLKEHPELIVTQSDKGNVTTVMDREQYNQLATNQLSDETFYKKLGRDPSNTYQQRGNKMIAEMKKKNIIDEDQARQLTFYRGTCPRYYGLPKIHKAELNLRPIISSIDSPNTRITNFLTDILAKSYNRENQYYIRDSFDFADFINNFKLPNGYVLVSWDAVSLFTNTTLDTAKRCIGNKWEDIGPNSPIDKDTFFGLFEFLFNTISFSFNGSYYKQKEGTPMGLKISGIVAEYVIDEALDYTKQNLPCQLPFCKKYRDDIITAIPKELVQQSLQVLNSFDTSKTLQFTVEEESDRSIPFLDMKVIREETNEGSTLMTDWYRKMISSDRYIHHKSYHPMSMKINIIKNLKTRITKICHPRFRDKNLKKLVEILRENDYPYKLLSKIIYSTPNSLENPVQTRNEEEPNKKYITLPHIEELTPLLRKLIPQDKFRIATRNVKPLKSIFTKLKDPTPTLQQNGVVYKISCNDCEEVYVGQTSTTLKQRLSSHRSDINNKKKTCALAIHTIEEDHHPNFEEVAILDREKDFNRRLFLEMVRISQEDHCMNARKDIQNLSNIYSLLIEWDKKKRRRSAPGVHSDSVAVDSLQRLVSC
ncbi:uncharacterized protein LOC123322469 [Coccinella septempunctata]|uniref:uncharacterized protein LOC123322469 n=1 Tax=Coccinella septempunctata TaxID=41139 RepID=UPI001D071EBE|nr:uncharacterized protein LOC123322469 [Coccinella septempunctata]